MRKWSSQSMEGCVNAIIDIASDAFVFWKRVSWLWADALLGSAPVEHTISRINSWCDDEYQLVLWCWPQFCCLKRMPQWLTALLKHSRYSCIRLIGDSRVSEEVRGMSGIPFRLLGLLPRARQTELSWVEFPWPLNKLGRFATDSVFLLLKIRWLPDGCD